MLFKDHGLLNIPSTYPALSNHRRASDNGLERKNFAIDNNGNSHYYFEAALLILMEVVLPRILCFTSFFFFKTGIFL